MTLQFKPMDEDAKSGNVILIRQQDGMTHAAYYGLAPRVATPPNFDRTYPWIILEPTNGTNGIKDGEWGPVAYALIPGAR